MLKLILNFFFVYLLHPKQTWQSQNLVLKVLRARGFVEEMIVKKNTRQSFEIGRSTTSLIHASNSLLNSYNGKKFTEFNTDRFTTSCQEKIKIWHAQDYLFREYGIRNRYCDSSEILENNFRLY